MRFGREVWRGLRRRPSTAGSYSADDETDPEGNGLNGANGANRERMSAVANTALVVALCRAEESAHLDGWFHDPLAEHIAQVAERNPQREPRPGLVRWVVTRTRFLDELLLDAVDPSEPGRPAIEQVVILGAGLDARAFRLPLPPATRVFEIDQASVLDLKRRLIRDIGLAPQVERREVVADFADPNWLDGLADAGWQGSRPTCWIAEGLLAYLDAPTRDRLLERLAAASPRWSRLGTTFSTARREGARLFQSWADEDPREWLGRLGWDVDVTTFLDAAAEYGRPLEHPLRPLDTRARERALAATLADATPRKSGDSPRQDASSQ